MYARSTTVQGSPSKIDEGIRFVTDQVMPMVEQLDGSVGLSLLVDRESGRCIITTAWDSEHAMRESADAVRDIRARSIEAFGGGQPEVAEWEFGLVHRVRPADAGACTRVIRASGPAGSMDDARNVMRTRILPQVEQIPGFCSVSMLTDPTTGRAATAVTYDSRASMDAADERGSRLRAEFAEAAGMQITEIAKFELAIAHLRVPELV